MAEVATRASYHHGDLPGALVDAAERLLDERTGWSFTLREVARAAGVSHNAPYNHFADRRALLAAVAARGFDGLTAALHRRLDGLDPVDVAAGIRALARGYAAFAAAHPSRFRLMFSAELTGCGDMPMREAGQRAFGVLRGLVDRGVAAGRLRPDPGGTHAVAAWSLMHGLSILTLEGRGPAAGVEGALEPLADALASSLLGGLAAPLARGPGPV